MIEPQRALVQPRVISPTTGQTLPLDDFITDPETLAKHTPIQLVGGPGAGKTTALRHARAVLVDLAPAFSCTDCVFLDEPGPQEDIFRYTQKFLVILAVREPSRVRYDGWLTLHLAPWDEDDLLAYLLARHKANCGTILARIRQTNDLEELKGLPALWTLTLDYFAGHPTLNQRCLTALRAAFVENLSDPALA